MVNFLATSKRGRPSASEIYQPYYLQMLNDAKARHGYSYSALAKLAGVSRYTAINVLKGRNRSPASVRRVANVVGISFALLLT